MNEIIGTLGIGIVTNFLHQALSEGARQTLKPNLESQVREALQGAFDKVSCDYGILVKGDSLTFWDRVSENMFGKMKTEKFEKIAMNDSLEAYIKDLLPEETIYNVDELCNSFWTSLYMEIAKFDELYKYYMLSTNKHQIDILLGIRDSINEISESKALKIEESAGKLYIELYSHTDEFAKAMLTYMVCNTRLSYRKSFEEEQEYRGRVFTPFSYLREISDTWSRDLSRIKKPLKKLDIDDNRIYEFYSCVNKCHNNSKNKEIRALIVNIPRFIFTNEFNKMFNDLDNAWQEYSALGRSGNAGESMSIINEMAECIKVAEQYENSVKELNPKKIISKEWIRILDKIESISIGEGYE